MENKSELKTKTIKAFIWKFLGGISSQAVSFVVSIILARILMPSEYGVIALSMIFLNVAQVFVTTGLGTSLVQKKDADELDFSTIFHAGIVVSVLLYAVLFLSAPLLANIYHNEQITNVFRALGLILPVSAINSVQQASVQRNLDFKKYFYATFTGTTFSGIVGILMAYHGFGVWALVGQQLSAAVANTFTLNRIITWRPRLIFSWSRFKALFGYGSKLMGSNLLGTICNELKGFLIGIYYKPADLAFYNRGDSYPSLVANNITQTINSVLFPVMAKLQDNPQEVKAATRRSMMTSSFVIVPIMLLLAATADKIIIILLTEKWAMAIPFMQVVCINKCVDILGTANLQALNATGHSGLTLKLEFIKKPIFIIFIAIGATISPLAIALGNLLYSIFGTTINAWPNRKYLHYGLLEQLKDIYPPLLLSAFVGIVIYFMGHLHINIIVLLLLQCMVGIVLYLGLASLFKMESYLYVKTTFQGFLKKRSL